MNGMLHDTFMTIHVTPESGFSYASCELHGLRPESSSSIAELVGKAASIFKPTQLVVSHTTHEKPFAGDPVAMFAAEGYSVDSVSSQALLDGGTVTFAALRLEGTPTSCGSCESESDNLPLMPVERGSGHVKSD
jgi:S-adenosylmethionine decarboxylase